MTKCGGQGYAYIRRDIIPRLKAAGVTDEQIKAMLADDVKAFFA